MCAFDQRMYQRTEFKKATFTGTVGGVVALPSLRTALWMRVTVDGVDAAAYFDQGIQVTDLLPRDMTMSGVNGTEVYYSRQHCGGAFASVVFVNANNLQTVRVTWCEFDAGTDLAING